VTAETLRKAAALMRERASSASRGPWRYEGYVSESKNPGDGGGWIHRGVGADEYAVAVTLPYSRHPEADATHIASWHPAVALAVADWLDELGEELQADPSDYCEGKGHRPPWPYNEDLADECTSWFCSNVDRGFTVARAYLGDDA